MNTNFTNQNIREIEQNGFITNCGPNHSLHVVHDDVGKYCDHLNSVANYTNTNDEYESIHMNEPSGDYTAIYKPEFHHAAKSHLDHYANIASRNSGFSRDW
ncbi:hypothetical protein [Pseudoalteromonas sp. 2CM28B]|uniref:hypothetical protein n=1 Tax=Pseudoalteromonas sp. 2CM28B TaxID=2929851 RepID=UPI0020BEA4DC|nr:hypothetical protein [Pseudoalteromonas sp. 2CM28B]MCK8133962.1 hypothetical protein [Pseudoalteromonas sp. 2CM28B]